MENLSTYAGSVAHSPSVAKSPFLTRTGDTVPWCSYREWVARIERMNSQDSISALQIVEGAGFSLAMVVRFALGHSASGGTVSAFATDSLYGWVVTAAVRHLLNAGSSVRVVVPTFQNEFSSTFSNLLSPLQSRGAVLYGWSSPEWGELSSVVESSHNVLCGMSDSPQIPQAFLNTFTEHMNESRVPVHCVGAPIGALTLHSSTEMSREKLYASSTLSLGLPLQNLCEDLDVIGRHYLCDANWSRNDYAQLGYDGPPLFCEQPVIQLVVSPSDACA